MNDFIDEKTLITIQPSNSNNSSSACRQLVYVRRMSCAFGESIQYLFSSHGDSSHKKTIMNFKESEIIHNLLWLYYSTWYWLCCCCVFSPAKLLVCMRARMTLLLVQCVIAPSVYYTCNWFESIVHRYSHQSLQTYLCANIIYSIQWREQNVQLLFEHRRRRRNWKEK